MRISFRTLLCLAKDAKDKEAQKAVEAFHSLTQFTNSDLGIRVWLVGGGYQVGLTRR